MSLESDFFKKKCVQFDRLEDFGFTKVKAGYLYIEKFMDDSFEARILIAKTGEVTGQVIDLDLGEEYLALRSVNQTGTFVGQVRQAYAEILGRIATACFEAQLFTQAQSNRLANRIAKSWGDIYDNPFEKYPDYVSYRVAGKWYALIFPIKMSKLGDFPKEIGEKEVEVINLKVAPDAIPQLLLKEGIYPSYHMSKKTWVSVVLDDGLSDDEIWTLIEQSRKLVAPKSFVSESGPDYWVIPANPKFYDIDTEFATHEVIEWTHKGQIKKDDVVFIYITAPVQSLRYACRVIEVNVSEMTYLDKPRQDKYMHLKLIKQLDERKYSLDFLKSHDVKAVRGPRRLTKSLIDVLKSDIHT